VEPIIASGSPLEQKLVAAGAETVLSPTGETMLMTFEALIELQPEEVTTRRK
jgi:hypothetical protein